MQVSYDLLLKTQIEHQDRVRNIQIEMKELDFITNTIRRANRNEMDRMEIDFEVDGQDQKRLLQQLNAQYDKISSQLAVKEQYQARVEQIERERGELVKDKRARIANQERQKLIEINDLQNEIKVNLKGAENFLKNLKQEEVLTSIRLTRLQNNQLGNELEAQSNQIDKLIQQNEILVKVEQNLNKETEIQREIQGNISHKITESQETQAQLQSRLKKKTLEL